MSHTGTTSRQRPSTGGQPPRSPRRRLTVIITVVVVLAVLAALAVALSRSPGGDSDAGGEVVELSHVHGLGVDPADGQLYAGTHYGLIRVPEDGDPTLVGEVTHDFMGFTVVGPEHYLASGHPGEGHEGPGNLGLIESTDGGRTWETVSLGGEADFHALEATHGQVYGYHGGQIMVSQDQESWETRGGIALADFAVSATDPDVLLATTQQGLGRSTDGGASFELVGTAPLLQLVSWAEGDTVVGIAPDGVVHVSEDAGDTWEQRGSVGEQPQALEATGDEIFVALDGAIVVSDDGGRNFQNYGGD